MTLYDMIFYRGEVSIFESTGASLCLRCLRPRRHHGTSSNICPLRVTNIKFNMFADGLHCRVNEFDYAYFMHYQLNSGFIGI